MLFPNRSGLKKEIMKYGYHNNAASEKADPEEKPGLIS